MLTATDPTIWQKHDDNFKMLLSDEIDLLFKEPSRIAKAFDEESGEATLPE